MTKVKQRRKPPSLGITRPQNKHVDSQRSAMVSHPLHRQPLIIHTFSPEIIHANAYDFMNLVQRLTGRTSYVSPPSKRPRHDALCLSPMPSGTRHASAMHHAEVQSATSSHMPALKEQHPASLPKSPWKPHQEQQKSISELASRRGLSPRVMLGLTLQTALSPHSRVGAGIQGGVWEKSPADFEFSPSTLPTPPAFLHDFPKLLSPYAHGATLLSPMGMRVGAVARSPMMMPFMLPSPGPLTTAFFADLPTLSPAAQSWIDKPLSAELVLSPMSRGFGLPPRPPYGHEKSPVRSLGP